MCIIFTKCSYLCVSGVNGAFDEGPASLFWVDVCVGVLLWPKNGLGMLCVSDREKSGYLRLPVHLGLVR